MSPPVVEHAPLQAIPQPGASEPQVADLIVDWLDALLSSASVDRIGREHWWPRATVALITAAATADDYSHAVAIACHKLQIDVLSEHSARRLAAIEPQARAQWDAWRTLAERDAPYLVALCRVQRQSRRQTTPSAPQATQAGLPTSVEAQDD